MIGAFLGNQNSGKTLSMVLFAYRYYIKGYEIYSNVGLNFPYNPLTKSVLEEFTKNQIQFKKAIFLIDEAYLFFDSRSSISKKNKIFSYMILQTSKRDINLFVTAQFFKTLDVRFRDHCFFQCFCDRHIYYKDKYISLKTTNRILSDNMNEYLYIKNTFYVANENTFNMTLATKKFYIKAKPVFNLYNTREVLAID